MTRSMIRLSRALVVLVVLIGLAIYAVLEYQNRHYAANYFSFINYGEVLESRKWHSSGLACTYAIVSLVDMEQVKPPSKWIDPLLWHQTPLRFKEKGAVGQCRNIICECESDWSPATYQLLTRALSKPGSFYYVILRQPPHDTLYQETILVYSPIEKVAARIRFGD